MISRLRLLIVSLVLISVAPALLPGIAQAAPTYEDQVMEILNQERWNNGSLPPLKRNAALDLSSETHSSDMATRDFFAHCDLDTKTQPWDRMTAAGYTGWNAAAENIAAGSGTPADVMAGWMNSSGHRANILSTTYREVGIGYFSQTGDQGNVRGDGNGDCTADTFTNGPFVTYWTQNFGRIGAVYPVVINREAYETSNPLVNLYVYGEGWAVDMRFRNEAGAWSAWLPYVANTTWTLSPGGGTKTVSVELRNGATVRSASDTIELNTPVTDAGPGPGRATALVMRPNQPNPFRSHTLLSYDLPAAARVTVAVFDLAGREVATLVDAFQDAGPHDVVWTGRDQAGGQVAPGVYFGRLEAQGQVRTTKLLLQR